MFTTGGNSQARPQAASSQFLLQQSGRQSKHHRPSVSAAATPLLWTPESQPCRDFFRFQVSSLLTSCSCKGDGSFLHLPLLLYLRIFFYLFLHNTTFLIFPVQITDMVFVSFLDRLITMSLRLENQNAWVQILALILPNSIISLYLTFLTSKMSKHYFSHKVVV